MGPIEEAPKKEEKLTKIYLLESWYDGDNALDHPAGSFISVKKATADQLIAIGTAEPEV